MVKYWHGCPEKKSLWNFLPLLALLHVHLPQNEEWINVTLCKHKGLFHNCHCQKTISVHTQNTKVKRFVIRVCSVAQTSLTLCNHMDCSPPGSSIHGILQTRILESGAICSSMGSSPPRDGTWVSCISCVAGRFFTSQPSGKPNFTLLSCIQLLLSI